ncbi:uncharacterized protein LOC111315069 [Durio zibethinus]|uniref:Uncharacterized protein LOC111315069 n=1 Tax=Durio zibethinus TaxID=66656 RepID=A0A6P6B5G7_DURZI|nr:uncharacterized protein LOC111315069 [Durio zibethinus]
MGNGLLSQRSNPVTPRRNATTANTDTVALQSYGASGPVVSSWIPEDDLLLKNAIEAGASLESIAKGAVQFSRKFTVRELQGRWRSLLYDPVVSEEASARIIEFERPASTLSSKFGRTGNLEDSKTWSGKRKPESVRSCYYALRKRIQNEPFNSMDLSFLIAADDGDYVGIEGEPIPGNCMLGNPISDNFEVQETNMNITHCSFSQMLDDDGAATRDGCTTDGFLTTTYKRDDDGFPAEPVNINKEIPHVPGENQFVVESDSGIEELHESKESPLHSLFEANDLMVKPSSTFDQINNDPQNICSEFEGDQVFNSPIMRCALSIWRIDEGLSASAICVDDGHGEEDLHIPCEELENPTADTEGYLVEITNTFMNDESFFMDVDAKDVIDKSYFDCLNSLLASSPNNCDQDQMPDVTEVMTSETQDNLAKVSCSHLEEVDEVAGSCIADGSVSCNSEVPMLSSVSTSKSQFPELTNGIICCTLNTEDTEIPCNEDVVFPKQLCPLVISSTRHIFKEAGNPLSVCAKDFSGGQRTREGGTLLVQTGQKDPGQSHGSSQIKRSQMIPEIGQLHPLVKSQDSPCVTPRSIGFLANGSAQINSINVSEGTLPPTLPNEKIEGIILGKHLSHSSADSLIEKPDLCSDSHNSYPLVNSSAIKQEVDAPEMIKDHQASSAAVGSMDIISPEPVIHHPPPDLEELLIESDDDVPCFSDIEAMVCHQLLWLSLLLLSSLLTAFSLVVLSFMNRFLIWNLIQMTKICVIRKHEDTIRAIIRLEQASHSYMQRAIASHGAFTILYGRHSKHYIKKPKILLGRTTEDFIVDINLGRQGCANKVSRRQAIINMEEDGSFHLKNLGKCSISINSKEVAPGQSLSLNTSCLIEIRGMPFIFETNQTRAKQYLNSVAKSKKLKM